MPSHRHPLDPLSAEEISVASLAARKYLAERCKVSEEDIRFAYTQLDEPPKAQVLAFLGITGEATKQLPPRRAEAVQRNAKTGRSYEMHLTFYGDKEARVEDVYELPSDVQPMLNPYEMDDAISVVKNDPDVIKACADVGIPPEQIEVDSWPVGWEPRVPQSHRVLQGMMYVRLEPHSNHYGNPLDFGVLVDVEAKKVIQIDYPSVNKNTLKTPKSEITTEYTGQKKPVEIGEDSLKASGRDRIKPDLSRKEYLPEILAKTPGFEFREPVKPLNITQPEGVSFKLDGRRIQWQGWDFHIGFTPREGATINAVQFFDFYEQKMRPLFYRLSVTEMVVPYGDPAWPHPRKHAFDVGECGLGILSNELTLGCDCVGAIHYMDFPVIARDFKPYVMKNVVCIHEEDDGFLWKHKDFREGGRQTTVRSRKLIVQFVATVANYEYAFNWIFRQDASVELEVKLTGILNTVLAAPDEISPYGTTVAKGVMAQNHQHLFAMYMNPMLDGLENSFVESDVVQDPHPTGSPENYAGNGFMAVSKVAETTDDGVRDPSPATHRTWSFVNLDRVHPTVGKPMGYKFLPNSMPPLLPRPDSIVAKRGPFTTHGLWVAPREEDQLFPAGKHVLQSLEMKDTVVEWTKGSKPIKQKDLSAWLTIGITHVPRAEDFPMMPKEWINVMIKPFNFFTANPANDIPPSTNKTSKLVTEEDTKDNKGCSCA